MRIVPIVAAVLMLAGCNVVTSKVPLFSVADEAPGQGLRPGLWVLVKSDCPFDVASPQKSWPDCADPGLVGAHTLGDPDGSGEVNAYVLAAGDPLIVQMAEPSDAGPLYFYSGLRALQRDSGGRIIEAHTWTVQCGPPPPEPAKGDPPGAQRHATLSPLPGLVMNADDSSCVAADPAAVRAAARASEAWDASPGIFRWVRDKPD